jgi:hypothetical protein
MNEERPSKELGDLIVSLAQKRHAHDHHAIAEHVQKTTRYKVSPHVLAEYLDGTALPEPEFFPAFAEAFSLTVEERRDLAWL